MNQSEEAHKSRYGRRDAELPGLLQAHCTSKNLAIFSSLEIHLNSVLFRFLRRLCYIVNTTTDQLYLSSTPPPKSWKDGVENCNLQNYARVFPVDNPILQVIKGCQSKQLISVMKTTLITLQIPRVLGVMCQETYIPHDRKP